ncbi:SWIB complex BAF60b domain containing protein [Gracilaria domingensis]|nr:SWIB complex BAF60b domain containing protein [Gracilaria domingensis]
MSTIISAPDGLAFAVSSTVLRNGGSKRAVRYDNRSTISTKPHYRVYTRTHAVMIRHANTPIQPKKQLGADSVQHKYIRRTGMNTPVVVSKELRDCIGVGDLSNRTQVIAGFRKYVRENNLYVGSDTKRILCDERLSSLINFIGELDFWDVYRLLKRHVTDPADLGPEYESRAHDYYEKYLEQRGALASSLKPQRSMDPRGKNSAAAQKQLKEQRRGMFVDVCVAPCLRPLCDGKSQMSRPQVLKSVWAYIKKQNLQDAKNRRRIRVTETLRDALRLPDVEWIDSFRLGGYIFKLTSKRDDTT